MPRHDENSNCETSDAAHIDNLKRQLRKQAHVARQGQRDKDRLSRSIIESCLRLPEVERAGTVMFYVDVRDEVRTRNALPNALASSRQIVVPWCNDAGELELFRLESLDDLAPGMFGILEPAVELRRIPHRCVGVSELEAIIVPGLAFDSNGGRLGHGRAYYDRLLQHAKPECPLVGLAWECQMFEEIPMGEHDVFMDFVVTERTLYVGKGS
jgi:5-formyltetrahydrofolate cyclo-ligase